MIVSSPRCPSAWAIPFLSLRTASAFSACLSIVSVAIDVLFHRPVSVLAKDLRMVAQMVLHEGLNEVVAVIVVRLHAELKVLPGLLAGGHQQVRL